MTLFEPSTLLAIFPYIFISAFPIFGIFLVTWWIVKDKKATSSSITTKNAKTNTNKDKENRKYID
ncbi:MAG TPA: hypothetical protein VFX18_04380 [Candidatus Nitrosocosmicus sp.]|nr:hypothetical protein [Candidatus Nitrosocosmicus sp.]